MRGQALPTFDAKQSSALLMSFGKQNKPFLYERACFPVRLEGLEPPTFLVRNHTLGRFMGANKVWKGRKPPTSRSRTVCLALHIPPYVSIFVGVTTATGGE
jgi:hypothetical protein